MVVDLLINSHGYIIGIACSAVVGETGYRCRLAERIQIGNLRITHPGEAAREDDSPDVVACNHQTLDLVAMLGVDALQ